MTADQDDNKFVDCAITANAEYIVTEDHHFNELKNISFPSVAIINLKDFAKTL
ncbi:PIN domain-containing protein [Phocaeicola coprocola]|uniref:PIN domain-containing protein n=1 Tax=Phocaeicola coprocola TaxID=310298 RepID=UPI003A8D651E